MMKIVYISIGFVLAVILGFTKVGRKVLKKWKDEPATFVVSMIVWFLGVFYCSRTTNLIPHLLKTGNYGDLQQVLKWTLLLVCWTSVAHQFLIFVSLHQLDHKQALRDKLKGWFGHPFEWILRLLAIVLLLYVCGEIPRLLAEYFHSPSVIPPATPSAGPIPTPKSVDNYAYYACGLFFVLWTWDLIGLIVCRWKWEFLPPSGPTYWFTSDLVGLVTWVLITVAIVWAGWVAILSLLFLVAYIVIISSRMVYSIYKFVTE